jgi:SAM-dependent methyltransferase
MVFEKKYSTLYDRFYRDKDYPAECDLIEEIFRNHTILPQTILDLGCGTGGHALNLARRGYCMTGVDRSGHMLEIAKRKAKIEKLNIDFNEQDISVLALDSQFDAIISMFAVIGYIPANDELEKAFVKIWEHLKQDGILIFDCWYGPAVLTERPESRVRTFGAGKTERVLRLVMPELDVLNHVVKVNYQVVHIEGSHITNETNETHTMRFFFPLEIEYFLKKAGFSEVHLFPFGDISRELTLKDWNMLVVAR